ARVAAVRAVGATVVGARAIRPASLPVMPARPALYPTVLSPAAVTAGEVATVVLLQTDSGMVALNKNSIEQITRLGGPLKTSVERKTRGPALSLRATNPRGDARGAIHYLARGISCVTSDRA